MPATIGTPGAPGTLDAILKNYYIGPLQEQLNNEVMVLGMFEKAKITWAGRQGVVPVHVGRNAGVGFRAESGTLPAAVNQVTERMTFTAAYLYGRFQVTGPAIASAAKGGTASFIGALELEMDKLKDDIRNQADRTAISGGRVVGFLSQYNTVPGAAADWAFRGDLAKIVQAQADVTAASAGQLLQLTIVNGSNSELTQSATAYDDIATVDFNGLGTAAGTINLSTLTTATVVDGFGAAVVIAPAQADAASTTALAYLDNEPTGIYGNLGSGAHFGIDRSAAAAEPLQSIIMSADTALAPADTGVDLTLERMQQMFDSINVTSGMDVDVILMNPIMRARYTGLITNNIFKPVEKATTGDGGFLGLSYGGVPIKSGRHIDNGLMLFLNTKCWKLAVLEEGKFADLDGSVLSRVPGNDSWEGFYKWYYNHYCYRPNANGVLTGIVVA